MTYLTGYALEQSVKVEFESAKQDLPQVTLSTGPKEGRV